MEAENEHPALDRVEREAKAAREGQPNELAQAMSAALAAGYPLSAIAERTGHHEHALMLRWAGI